MKLVDGLRLFPVAALLVCGCASKEVTWSSLGLEPLKDAAERTPVNTSLRFVIDEVSDERGVEPRRVGTATTGMQHIETPIYFERSVASVVKDQFTKEMANRQIPTGEPADVHLKLKIINLDIHEKAATFPEASVCQAKIEIAANAPKGHTTYKGQVSSEFQSPGSMDTTKRDAGTWAGCVNLVVEQLFKQPEFRKASGLGPL